MSDSEIVRTLAHKVMGWKVCDCPWHPKFDPIYDIADAFRVVEKMRELGYLWAMRLLGCGDVSVQFWRNATDPHATEESGSATEREICRAICLAAIAALKGK